MGVSGPTLADFQAPLSILIAPSVLIISDTQHRLVVEIRADGRIFWRGREVKTDREFRAAMKEVMSGMAKGCVK
jgi:hypothetical protein